MRLSERVIITNLFAFLVAINLYILWSLNYLPFMDHPSHLFRIFAFANLDNPLFNFSDLFKARYLVPNIGGDLVTVAFIKLGFDVYTASKLFYTFYIIGLPASVIYFLYKTNPDNLIYSFHAVLITYNYSLVLGNENFIFSIPFFIWGLTYWFTRLDDERRLVYLYKLLFLEAVYLIHGFTFFLFVFSIIVMLAFSRISQKNRIISQGVTGLVILQYFTSFYGHDRMIIFYQSFSRKLFYAIPSVLPKIFSANLEIILGGLIIFGYLGLLVKGLRDDRTGLKSPWLYISASFLIFWLVLPHWLVLSMPDMRVGILAFLLITTLFSNHRYARWGFLVIVIPLILSSQFYLTQKFRRGDENIKYITEVFDKLPENQAFLPLILPPVHMDPALHRVFEYYHIEKGGHGPYDFVGKIYILDYQNDRLKLDAPPILDKDPRKLTEKMLSAYDLVGIIGREDTGIFKAYVQAVTRLGFLKVAGYKKNVLILRR